METEKSRSQKITNLFRPKSDSQETHKGEGMSRREEEMRRKAEKLAREGLSDSDYSLLKIFAVIIAKTVSALLFSYALIFWPFFYAVAAGFFSISLIALVPLLIKSWSLNLASAFTISIAFILPLFFLKNIPPIPAGIVAIFSIIVLMGGFISAKRELNNSLRISFTKFSGAIIARALTVIALVLAVAYGWNFQARALFSDQFISTMMTFASPLIEQRIPGFTPQMELNIFFDTFVRQSFVRHDAANFTLLPINLQQQLISQSTINLYQTIENSLGMDINLKASFQESLKTIILEKVVVPIEAIPAEHLALIATAIIFIAVRGPFWLLSWLVMAVSFILLQLLLVTKFAETYLEPRSKEIILIK